jgi:hypothetical protein
MSRSYLTHSVSIRQALRPAGAVGTLTIDRGLRSATKRARTSVKRLVLEQHDLFSNHELVRTHMAAWQRVFADGPMPGLSH